MERDLARDRWLAVDNSLRNIERGLRAAGCRLSLQLLLRWAFTALCQSQVLRRSRILDAR
eukprot:scaffold31999_cov47-Prasinocladus_malaysianus.AAC.1